MIGIFLYFVLPIFSLIYFYFKSKFSYFERKGIPHVKPGTLSLMGNMSGIGTECHFFDRLQEVYEECKEKDKVFGFYSSIQPNYVIADEKLVKLVLIKDFNNFVNRGIYVNEEDEPLTGHLFSIEDDRWRFLRHKLSPVFTSGKLKAMYPEVVNKSENLKSAIDKKLTKSNSIELKDIAHRYMVDIISSVAFGMEANTLNGEHDRLIEMLKEIFPAGGSWAMFNFFICSTFPKIGKLFGLKLFSKNVTEFFTEVVSGNIRYREETNDNRKDFLNMLIQLKNKGSIEGEISTDVKKLTLNEVLAQAFLFLFAGSDTSSTTVAAALCELSHNEEIQEKLRKEIDEKSKDGEITYESLNEMKYLKQIVDETLRMYPPAFFLFRRSKNDYKIPNSSHIIPKDSPVWIPAVGFHYDERYWPNPKKFDPERFTQEEIEKRSPYVYLPFGEGPRNCIGMRFGLLNVKLAIATIVKNYKLTPDEKTPYPIKINPKCSQLDGVGGFSVQIEKIKAKFYLP